MSTPCFWLEPIRRARLSLRRYSDRDSTCPSTGWAYHNAQTALFDVDERLEPWGETGTVVYRHDGPQTRADVPPACEWPPACACGYVFAEADPWQVFSDHLYQRTDTGSIVTLRTAPAGAMWDAAWMPADWKGSDGRALIVRLPNGHDWHVDGRASNCTQPDDYPNHRCWTRHGEPPLITVDKRGRTCAAGAGSIQAGNYHGFLQAGVLT
jgi:hypothetical protein